MRVPVRKFLRPGDAYPSRRPAVAKTLAKTLERVYARYNHRSLVGTDPLQFAYRYDRPRDIEVAAFLAAALAYGRVQQIHRSLTDLFARTGPSPYEFVIDFSTSSRAKLATFKHRFTSGDDISDLLGVLRPVLHKYGDIEAFFAAGCDASDETVVPALSRFCDTLTEAYARKRGGHVNRALMYLLASPSRGSASKRLHLFLRWMVRKDDVDLGLWTSIDKAKLIVPVDVHMGRLCRILGLHDSNTISLATAIRITQGFARIEPADPVKYDFALSRIGIVDNCTGRLRDECACCQLHEICLERQ